MYAHQVIEDLFDLIKQAKSRDSNNKATVSMWEKLIPAIKNAQKFHLGDGDALSEVTNIVGQPVFMEHEDMRLPYRSCWFDCFLPKEKKEELLAPEFAAHGRMTNTKEAVWVWEVAPTAWYMHTFTYAQELKKWIPGIIPVMAFIGGNHHANNRELARQFSLKNGGDGTDIEDGNILPLAPNNIKIPYEEVYGILKECSINYALVDNAVKLLNCKNITTEEVKASDRLNKKRRKAGKVEIFDYRVLTVTVPTTKGGYSEKTAPLFHNRVHLCRGHFKMYTQEHPLFGRHTGRYWWQPQVRGENKAGIIMKDYTLQREGK